MPRRLVNYGTKLQIKKLRQNTKVVLYEFHYVEQVIETFQKCEWEHINLEFRDLELKYYPSTFWENIGDRVYSIKFVNCEPTSGTIKHIILSCGHLQHLMLGCRTVFSRSMFDDLIRHEILCRSLQSLEMKFCSKSLSEDVLNDIFGPKIFQDGCF